MVALELAPRGAGALFVASQYLARCTAEIRTLIHAYAEQRIHRRIGRQLFEHLICLPLQFHLGRRVGGVGETAAQGFRGYQLLLTHIVYTILPVTVELGFVAVVLLHFNSRSYLVVIAISSVAYVSRVSAWRAYRTGHGGSRFSRAHRGAGRAHGQSSQPGDGEALRRGGCSSVAGTMRRLAPWKMRGVHFLPGG